MLPFRPGINFINVLCTAFYVRRSWKCKNSVKLSVSFYSFGIRVCKSFVKTVDEIDTRWRTGENNLGVIEGSFLLIGTYCVILNLMSCRKNCSVSHSNLNCLKPSIRICLKRIFFNHKVCRGFTLTKRFNYFWVIFDQFDVSIVF